MRNDLRLGQAVALLREQHDWTQTDLALRCGVSKSAIAKFEKGLCDRRLHTVAQLAKAFGLQDWQLIRLARRLDAAVEGSEQDAPALDPELWGRAA